MNRFVPERTERYRRQAKRLPQATYKKLTKCLELLLSFPRHPSLQTHKVKNAVGQYGGDIFEAYIDRKYRLTWEYAEQNVISLRNVDNHDECLKNP